MRLNEKIGQAVMQKKKSNLIKKAINKITTIYVILIFIFAPIFQNISYANNSKDKSDIESEFLSSIDMVLDILKKDKEMSDY